MNNKCKYQIKLKDFPYYCCSAQKSCPTVICPLNYKDCEVYKNIILPRVSDIPTEISG